MTRSSDRNPDTALPPDAWPAGGETAAEAALPDFLLRQRWYPAKDAGRPAVRLSRLAPLAAAIPAAAAIWQVTPPGQPDFLLFVPLALAPEAEADPAQVIAAADEGSAGRVLVDAVSQDAFIRAWVGMMLRPGPGVAGLRGARTDAFSPAIAEELLHSAIRRSRAEQSNTSIRIGERAILKVIRKLERGTHPELEFGRFLSGEGQFAATPALFGWIDMADEEAEITLSILQAFVPNQGDGWGWMLERLRGAGEPDGASRLDETIAWLRRLGTRTAELHCALAAAEDDPAFRPEPVGAADVETWRRAAGDMARRALDGLAAARGRLDPTARTRADRLLESREAVAARIADWLPEPGAFDKTRHHGDFHLGQVLVAGEDAVIIDFEGEPMRPLAERRAKHAALRDVAGLLRSLSYAAATARREAAAAPLAEWEEAASAAFLDAYLAAAAGGRFLPADHGACRRTIRFFMLEKALYEIAYELANRPDWVEIPLRGVLALLDERHRHPMPFGAELAEDGRVRFRLWAPSHAQVGVEIDGGEPMPLQTQAGGWHEVVTDRARAGSRYRFVLPDGMRVPDPASRHQPEDVHGPSEVIDPLAYRWRDTAWRGRPWAEAVLYELHVGAFTPEGTFRAAIERLDHLVGLGVTAIEIMPIADFPGRRNWGYDGVLPYAPDGSYGRPEDLKALVDAAHRRGLMVLLDVVYNHFGPEGAYLHRIAPQFFTDRHKTPWGAAINMDGDDAGPVRDFFIHNALFWIEEYRLDGLRLDAVHAILDDSPRHFLDELAERVRAAFPHRHVHLVLENEENAASRLRRDAAGRPRRYTAQWNDDVHHVLHVAATGERSGYYADYIDNTERLGRALAEGFAFQGEVMPYRGHPRGEPSAGLPPTAFVAFAQNHDQVGNRAFGDRLAMIAPAAAVRAVGAVYLLLPQIPMLFMGEEWAAAQPFPFFCDFEPELAEAVRNGRREEFKRFPEFQDPAARERIPDPTAEETFLSAKLAWGDVDNEPHAGMLEWHRQVLAVRRKEIVPLIGHKVSFRGAGAAGPGSSSRPGMTDFLSRGDEAIRHGGVYQIIGDGALVVRWPFGEGGALRLDTNLSGKPVGGFLPLAGRTIWREGKTGEDGVFAPFSVRWSIEDPTALDRLAVRMGIEPEFENARGHIVRTGTATKRALLSAMGIEAPDNAGAAAALDRLDRTEWLRPLPPVQVSRADAGPVAVLIALPAGTRQVEWRLILEDGTQRSGREEFIALPLSGERDVDGRPMQRRRLIVGDALPLGYHRLEIEPGGAATTLIVAPESCWLPPDLARGRRIWGIAAQLYLLRSERNWGIGDYGDLRRLVELAAGHGADVIGLNPLHALFADAPEHASPYSPASRLLLNVLNIDIGAIPELSETPRAAELIRSPGFQEKLAVCRGRDLVDYAGVAALKLQVLELLFEACRTAPDPTRWRQFEQFCRDGGEEFRRNCLLLALRENSGDDALPAPYRDPASPETGRFAEEQRDRVEFTAWRQWIADEQLAAAAADARERMAVGLYRDLAVGADPAGAEVWANPDAVVTGAQVGAPPDIYNPAGQNWGLPPFDPQALRDEAYRSFVSLVRANMRHAGGLRIDHAMGLLRLYWIPAGQPPSAGAYVRYPIEDLLGILALESHRHRCIVVGEDLGTVPDGFRERMAAANILSYRVLFFEQEPESGEFLPPEAYPKPALAVVASHDLPTLRGWWEGGDLDLKERLGLYPDPAEAARQRAMRQRDREGLLAALRGAGLLPAGSEPDIPSFCRAAHAYLARTPAMLAMAQIDDLTDEADPVNVPATADQYPNWRRRLSLTLDELAACRRFLDIAEIFNRERGPARAAADV